MSTDGGSPEVRVIDHGGGVAPRSSRASSTPSSRARSSTPGRIQGVGLGLTLARMSARAMDGDVVLESTGPHGSTFLWAVSAADQLT